MKKSLVFIISLALPVLSYSQNQEQQTGIVLENNGIIQSVEFLETETNFEIPKSPADFFNNYLKITSNDQFKQVPHTSKRKEFKNEHFDQYFNGIIVDGGGYNFHYKNNKMYFASGHYVKINDLKTTPDISPEAAKESFANNKNIPLALVTNYISNLMIKEISYIQGKTLHSPQNLFTKYIYILTI